MEKTFIDFRKNGFLIKRLFLFYKTTFILLDDVPKKVDSNNYDLKFELAESLLVEARLGFLDFDSLKTKSLKIEKSIFINYKDYTLHILLNSSEDVFSMNGLIYNSTAMKNCVDEIKNICRTKSNLVIYGDTGTGKEFLARIVHFNSVQRKYPFFVFNAALFENEKDLLGSERGAYTSSLENTKGIFFIVNKGILVLDGLEHMSLKAQSIFLRVLEDQVFKKLGSDLYNKSNFRVISIFNKNPIYLIEEGVLRKDLYYRLAANIIELPSLTSRLEDIEPLIDFFTKGYKLSYRAMELLKEYKYSGNVRELINVLNRAKILSIRGCIDKSNIIFNEIPSNNSYLKNNFKAGLLRNRENTIISRVLKFTSSNVLRASKILGVTRVTLHKKIKELN